MAKVSGAAAYQQLRPSQDGLSQGAQYWGGMGMNLAQQNQRIKQREKELERAEKVAAQKAFDEKFAKSNEALKLFDTKVNDLNTVIAKGVFRLKEENAKAFDVLDPNNTSATPMERMEARLKIQKIQEAIPMMRAATQSATDHFSYYDKGIQEGKYIADPDYIKFRENAYDFGNDNKYIEVAFDDDMNLFLLNRDDEGDISETSLTDLVSGNIPKPMQYIDYNVMVGNTAKSINTLTEQWDEGLTKRTRTDINTASEDMLNDLATTSFAVDENGRPSAELAGYIQGRGYDPFSISPDKLNEFAINLQDKFKRDVMANVKQEDKSEYNHSAANQRARLAFERDKHNAKGGKSGISFAVDQQSGNIVEREIEDANGVKTTAYALVNNDQGKPFVLDKTKSSETRTDNLYITADGNIYGDVYKVESMSSFNPDDPFSSPRETISSPENRWLTKEEANKIAVERGYTDAREMYVNLDEERRGRQGSQSQELDEFGVPIN